MPPLYAHDPFLAIQHGLTTPWLDGVMVVLTVACEGWALAVLTLAVAFALERQAQRALAVALPALVALTTAGIAASILKHALDLPRPLSVLGSERVHLLLEPLRRGSFPSGHAVAAGVVAAYFASRYGARAWPLGALALSGALSRVYVGAHWTVDVAAGLLLGAAAGALAAAAARALAPRALHPEATAP